MSNGRLTRVARLHYMSRDHPIAHEFSYHIRQPSPAPGLLSAQAPGHASRQERGRALCRPQPAESVPAAFRGCFRSAVHKELGRPGVELVNDSRIVTRAKKIFAFETDY